MSSEYLVWTAWTTGDGPVTPNGMFRGYRSWTALTRHKPNIAEKTRTSVNATTGFFTRGHLSSGSGAPRPQGAAVARTLADHTTTSTEYGCRPWPALEHPLSVLDRA
jgi:hypothetical protein